MLYYYYYLDGLEKKGPFTKDEFVELKLSNNTLISRNDKSNWTPKSDFNELMNYTDSDSLKSNKVGSNSGNSNQSKTRFFLSSLVLAIVIIVALVIYNQNSLDEKSAKDISLKFFNMLTVKNNSSEDFEKIYPSFRSIGNRVVFNNICEITNLTKNDEGDYEIFASYKPNKITNHQIYLLVSKENGFVFIKSSKGINYAYYDNVLNFGKKKGCLSGSEDDVKMGLIIVEKNLKYNLELETKLQIQDLYSKIKKTSNIQKEYGYAHGDVTISNESNIFLSNYDFTCRIEFYDSNGQITSSEKLNFWEGIPRHGSASSSIYSSKENSSTFKIIFNLNDNELILNKLKEDVIEKTNFGCN